MKKERHDVTGRCVTGGTPYVQGTQQHQGKNSRMHQGTELIAQQRLHVDVYAKVEFSSSTTLPRMEWKDVAASLCIYNFQTENLCTAELKEYSEPL